jgi:MoxR-like ATPase
MLATTGLSEMKAEAIFTAEALIDAQRLVRSVPVGERVVDAVLRVVRAGRPETSDIPEVLNYVSWGPGPRASQALMLACRARALIGGRLAPSVDDVIALANPVLRHRMALSFAARAEGVTIDTVIERLCEPLR